MHVCMCVSVNQCEVVICDCEYYMRVICVHVCVYVCVCVCVCVGGGGGGECVSDSVLIIINNVLKLFWSHDLFSTYTCAFSSGNVFSFSFIEVLQKK